MVSCLRIFPFFTHVCTEMFWIFLWLFSSFLTTINYSFLGRGNQLLCCVYQAVQNSIGTLNCKDDPLQSPCGQCCKPRAQTWTAEEKVSWRLWTLFLSLSLVLSHDQCQVCVSKSIFPCSLFLALKDNIDSICQKFLLSTFSEDFLASKYSSCSFYVSKWTFSCNSQWQLL